MSRIILDLGSGNTCRNSIDYAKRMIDAVAAIDTHKHEVILKWQLEEECPPGQLNLDRAVFNMAYNYAESLGYKTTSSVFDRSSLAYLLTFDHPPFVKIACNKTLYGLIDYVPRGMPLYVSYDCRKITFNGRQPTDLCTVFACVPEYPANLKDYSPGWYAYSDHTPGLELWNYYHPAIWEKHFVLERDLSNPDAGPFACTPDELKEIL